MITIISSTNRKNSNSAKVALQYEQLLKNMGASTTVLDLTTLPDELMTAGLYENSGKLASFLPIMELMKSSSKYVFIVPEYNGSFPGVLKLFLDALEFPSTLKGKKCGLIGISSGVQGSALAMSHLTDIFNYLGMHVMAGKPKLSGIDNRMKDDLVADKLGVKLMTEHARNILEF